MGTGEFTAYECCLCDGLASHPGGVEILLVASRTETGINSGIDGPLGLNADFTFNF